MPEKFDIYSKIFYRDVEKFRHLCLLVLRHQMRVSNYFVNSFYSVAYASVYGNLSGYNLMKTLVSDVLDSQMLIISTVHVQCTGCHVLYPKRLDVNKRRAQHKASSILQIC